MDFLGSNFWFKVFFFIDVKLIGYKYSRKIVWDYSVVDRIGIV